MLNKVVSLLAVAFIATAIGSACARYTKCDEAKTEKDCTDKAKFEKEDMAKKCEWKKDAADKDKKGECREKPSVDAAKVKQEAGDACKAVATADLDAKCKDTALDNITDANIKAEAKKKYTCKKDTTVTPNACKAEDKQ